MSNESSDNICMHIYIYILCGFFLFYFLDLAGGTPSFGTLVHPRDLTSRYLLAIICGLVLWNEHVCMHVCIVRGMYVCTYVCMYVYLA